MIQKYNPVMDLRTGSVIQSAVSLIPLSILNWFWGSFSVPLVSTFIFALIWMALVVSVSATCLYYKINEEW